MKMIRLLIVLLSVTILLLLLDIITGIWYWNRLHLVFNAQSLNNIITPIIAIFSLIVYGYTLHTAIRQNRIALQQNEVILSQNVKPYYEREIDKYAKKAKKTQLSSRPNLSDEPLTPSNYIKTIISQLIILQQDLDYQEDYLAYTVGRQKEFDLDYIRSRNYFGISLFLTRFTMPLSGIKFFYNEIQQLVEEIDQSNLILQDKALLKKRIKRELLEEYFAFIRLMKPASSNAVPFPCLYQRPIDYENPNKIEFKTLAETRFKDHYDWFEKNLR